MLTGIGKLNNYQALKDVSLRFWHFHESFEMLTFIIRIMLSGTTLYDPPKIALAFTESDA